MHAVNRAQDLAEVEYLEKVYSLLESQAKQVLTLLRQQTDLPLNNARAQRILKTLVASYTDQDGLFRQAWIGALGGLYLGTIGTALRLLRAELPGFSLTPKVAGQVASVLTMDRAESAATSIAGSIADSIARDVNATALGMIIKPGEIIADLGDVVYTLGQGTFSVKRMNGRADTIAKTEAPGWLNEARSALVEADGGYTTRVWRTEEDDKVRETHAQQDGYSIPLRDGERYPNGCRFPGDNTADPGEFIRCRCHEEFH